MPVIESTTSEEIKTAFSALTTESKVRLLSLLAHGVTICARGAYPGQAPEHEVAEKLIAFNEIQHQISSMLRHLLYGDENRYPDEVFIDIIWEKARTGGLEKDLNFAFQFAFKHLS